MNQEQLLMMSMMQGAQDQMASSLPNGEIMPNQIMPIPGGVHQRNNITAGSDHLAGLKAAAHIAGAAAAMKPPDATASKEHDDDDVARDGSLKRCIKQCTPANIKRFNKMLKDGAILRPALTGICVLQVLLFGALYGTGMYPDNDALIMISTPADLNSLVDYGTADFTLIRAGELHRIIACLFIHGGMLHLMACLSMQLWFGEYLEFSMGPKKFVPLFL
jgi:hypothetical protein